MKVKTGRLILMVFGSLYLIAGIVKIFTSSFLEFIIFLIVAGILFWGAKKINDEVKKNKGDEKK